MKTVIFIIVVLSFATSTTPQCVAAQTQSGCATCANSHCIACQVDYKLRSTICLPCGEGFWTSNQNNSPECGSCARGAQKCTSSSILDITYCYPGWYRGNIEGCVRCPIGKTSPPRTGATGYETDSVCSLDCLEGVHACRGTSASDIEYCTNGFYKTYTGCLRCPSGTTRTPQSTATSEELPSNCDIDCAPGAAACTGTAATDATHCKDGYYKTSSGCTLCPAGKGKVAHALTGANPAIEAPAACDITCAPGIANCKNTSPTEAHWCLADYWWAVGVCTPCGEGKFKLAGNGFPTTFESPAACGTCATGASKCTGPAPENATHCMAGYFKLSSGCKICPNGTGKPAHDVASASPALENESNCTACPDIKSMPAGSITVNPASCNPTSSSANKSGSVFLMGSLSSLSLAAISLL